MSLSIPFALYIGKQKVTNDVFITTIFHYWYSIFFPINEINKKVPITMLVTDSLEVHSASS